MVEYGPGNPPPLGMRVDHPFSTAFFAEDQWRVWGVYFIDRHGIERIICHYSSPARNGHGHMVRRPYTPSEDEAHYIVDRMREILADG